MPVLFLIAIVAVLVGIFFAATGRGGELAYEQTDHAPVDLGPVSAADIALLRPPTAMWGYNMQVTDEALDRIARAMRERDVTIAFLQDRLATLASNGAYADPSDGYAGQVPENALAPEIPAFPEASDVSEAPAVTRQPPRDRETLDLPWDPEPPESPEAVAPPQVPQTAHTADAPTVPERAHVPDAPQPPEDADTVEAPKPPETPEPPQTPLVLKASPAKDSPGPDHEVTQPTEVLHDRSAQDATQPSQTLAPNETQGPQGAFDTHDWWAEQGRAAREEAARHQTAGSSGGAEDDSLAAAEEQGW